MGLTRIQSFDISWRIKGFGTRGERNAKSNRLTQVNWRLDMTVKTVCSDLDTCQRDDEE